MPRLRIIGEDAWDDDDVIIIDPDEDLEEWEVAEWVEQLREERRRGVEVYDLSKYPGPGVRVR